VQVLGVRIEAQALAQEVQRLFVLARIIELMGAFVELF
jgi:hypothetical protein